MTLRGISINFLLWLLLAALVAAGSAQTAPPPQRAAGSSANGASELSFEKRTHERKLREAKAELETVRQARTKVGAYRKWVFSLGISLILLGLIAGCAQLAADPWNKRVTTVAAAMVIAVTAAKTTYYPMERTAIDALVVPADDAITDQERFLGHYSEELQNDSPDQQTIKEYLDRLDSDRATILQVHQALRAAGLSLGLPTPLEPKAKQPDMKQPDMKQPDIKKGAIETGVVYASDAQPTVKASGNAQCNDPQAAREYARYSALEELSRKAVTRQRRDDLDVLIEHLGRSARLEDFKSKIGADGFTRYSITYSVPAQLLRDRAELQVGTKKEAFIQWSSNTVTVSRQELAAGKVRRVVPLFASKATLGPGTKQKFFDLHLELSVSGGKVIAELVQADTFYDGSTGATRWAFEVLINGQSAISFPSHRFIDTKKPTVCMIQAVEPRRGEASMADLINVQVNAYSPP